MKVFITGAKGFLGKNLSETLKQRKDMHLLLYDTDTDPMLLNTYAKECDFVFHLAGVNRPTDEKDYAQNETFTQQLLEVLCQSQNAVPILYSSSIQAALDNPYGRSKKAAEDLIFAYGREKSVPVYVYRLPNLFGKWCRPNYNSAVATFCHNAANGLPISVHDPNASVQLAYVDDVAAEFLLAVEGKPHKTDAFCSVEPAYRTTVGTVAKLIASFRDGRENLLLPNTGDPLTRALYATYLTYLPEDGIRQALKTNADQRGSFTELFHTADRGQVSVNIIRPGMIKGNHWHHTKNEKFIAVSGYGVIRLRKLGEEKSLTYVVSGDRPESIDIPPGYVHNIENLGGTDMVTVIWASENFDPAKPDTYFLEV